MTVTDSYQRFAQFETPLSSTMKAVSSIVHVYDSMACGSKFIPKFKLLN